MFAVRVSLGGPTAAPDAPLASDNAPATPNIVTTLSLRISVAMRHGGGLPFHPRAQQHINGATRRLPLRQLGDIRRDPPRFVYGEQLFAAPARTHNRLASQVLGFLRRSLAFSASIAPAVRQ